MRKRKPWIRLDNCLSVHVKVQGADVLILGNEPLQQVRFRKDVQDVGQGGLHVAGDEVDLTDERLGQIVKVTGL